MGSACWDQLKVLIVVFQMCKSGYMAIIFSIRFINLPHNKSNISLCFQFTLQYFLYGMFNSISLIYKRKYKKQGKKNTQIFTLRNI